MPYYPKNVKKAYFHMAGVYQCSFCDYSVLNERGIKLHYKMSHGLQPIENKIHRLFCGSCKKEKKDCQC